MFRKINQLFIHVADLDSQLCVNNVRKTLDQKKKKVTMRNDRIIVSMR